MNSYVSASFLITVCDYLWKTLEFGRLLRTVDNWIIPSSNEFPKFNFIFINFVNYFVVDVFCFVFLQKIF